MDNLMQKTIKNPISCFGVGLHSGKAVSLTFKPAPENSGIIFVRTDLPDETAIIEVNYKNVVETTLGTTISNEAGVKVSTIEHLMAAVWGCEITNLIIEIDGPEIPAMDGSASEFVFLLQSAAPIEQEEKAHYLEIKKTIECHSKDNSYIIAKPSDRFTVNFTIKFDSEAIGIQNYKFGGDNAAFIKHIANARTFGFMSDVDKLREAGLAKGASLENAVVINEDDQIMNSNGLRYPDEFVRHKLLDCIGDLYLGGLIKGEIIAYCSGHKMNNELLHSIFSNQDNWEYIVKVFVL